MALTREQLLEKIASAYQAVGQLIGGESDVDRWPTEAEQTRLLDYLADEDAFDPDWLWPNETIGIPKKSASA